MRNRISQERNVQINFSDKYDYYLSAYSDVCWSDSYEGHSNGHPDGLSNTPSPKTTMSIAGFQASCVKKRKSNGESSGANKWKNFEELGHFWVCKGEKH